MTFNEYQKKALGTDTFGDGDKEITSTAFYSKLLGLVGETGEVADKFKKIYRDKNSEMSGDDVVEMTKELGDVLWYLSVLAEYLGVDFEEVAQANIDKLASRKMRNKLSGSGDNR
jgi:NTP pyrophosphatase (non-canonical NTP hydrolase)